MNNVTYNFDTLSDQAMSEIAIQLNAIEPQALYETAQTAVSFDATLSIIVAVSVATALFAISQFQTLKFIQKSR